MAWLIPAIATALSTTLVLTFVYVFLYTQDRKRHLAIWAIGWAIYAVRFGFELWLASTHQTPILTLCIHLCLLLNCLFLLWGTYEMAGRPVPGGWLVASVLGGLWIIVATVGQFSPTLFSLPLSALLAAIFVWTGLIFLRTQELEGNGRYITGWTFIVWGLHKGDYPFRHMISWFSPWGFLLASALQLMAAIGILLTYFQKIRQDLFRGEERFRLLAENAQDVIYRYRLVPTPGFEYISPAVTRLTGYTPEEYYADPELIFGLMHAEDRTLVETLRQNPADPSPAPSILRWIRKDGEVIWTEQHNVFVHDEAGTRVAVEGIARDVTERKQRERELEVITQVATALRNAHSRADMLPIILDKLLHLLEAEGAAILMHDPDTGEDVFELAHGQWAHWTGTRMPPGKSVSSHVIATGEPYVNKDIRNDPRSYFSAEQFRGLYIVACAPLIAEEETIGVLWIGRRPEEEGKSSNGPISEGDVLLLTAIGDIAANALHRSRVTETLEKRVAERTADLEAANVRLKELDDLKSKFISDISHELRTPVTSMGVYLHLVEHGEKNKRTENLQAIRKQVDRLTSLVQSIFDISYLDLSKGKLTFAPVDINTITGQMVANLAPRAEDAGLSLIFEPAENIPLVWGQSTQLGQVVSNLITNAISYTPEGHIRLSTHVNNEERMIGLRVEDTGIGIDPEDRPYLFERFYRGKRVGQFSIPGTGLGLAIIWEIVKLHGGSVEVESQVDHGSVFTVWLPILDEAKRAAAQPTGEVETDRSDMTL